jgi:hypothetical protein
VKQKRTPKAVVKTKRKTKYGYYYQNEFVFSEAFQKVLTSKYGMSFLQCLFTELDRKEVNSKKIYVNNGKLSITYSQFKEITKSTTSPTGCCNYTFQSVRNLLIKVGIIAITYKSKGLVRGDMNQYKILLEKCGKVERGDERWRRYPAENWANEIPTQVNPRGEEFQWKKGHSGNPKYKKKKIFPLSEQTVISDNHPIRIDRLEKKDLIRSDTIGR